MHTAQLSGNLTNTRMRNVCDIRVHVFLQAMPTYKQATYRSSAYGGAWYQRLCLYTLSYDNRSHYFRLRSLVKSSVYMQRLYIARIFSGTCLHVSHACETRVIVKLPLSCTVHAVCTHVHVYVYIDVGKHKLQDAHKQSKAATQLNQGSLFQRKTSSHGWKFEPTTLYYRVPRILRIYTIHRLHYTNLQT